MVLTIGAHATTARTEIRRYERFIKVASGGEPLPQRAFTAAVLALLGLGLAGAAAAGQRGALGREVGA